MVERRPYITRQGEGYDLSLAGPFRNRSANMQLHVLDAKLIPLLKTLYHYLNHVAPAGVTYLPLGDRVVVSCVDIPEGRAGDESLGSTHEVEVAFFILALRCDPLPSGIVAFNPYLFVNQCWAMVMGREIHGFRKEIATSFSQTLDVDGPGWTNRARDVEHVEAWAMRHRAPGSRLERMKLMEIRHPAEPAPRAGSTEALIPALIGHGPHELPRDVFPHHLADKLPGFQALSALLMALLRGSEVHVTSVFLRQFRDPRQSAMADVQDIVEATSIATPKGKPVILPPSEIFLHRAASHPIARELGLDDETWIRANLSMEVNMDFVLNDAV
jgi:hypothetical protein